MCRPDSKRSRQDIANEELESGDEAEYEKLPRQTEWDKKNLHYLLPLKATHGTLIPQAPTQLEQNESSELTIAFSAT